MPTYQAKTIYVSSNASQTVYTFTWDFIDSDYVKVYADDVLETGYTVSAGQITLAAGVAIGVELAIIRETPAAPLVDFSDGAVITENDLDTMFLQCLHVAVEANDDSVDGMQLNAAGTAYDAESKPIENIAAPSASGEAARKDETDALDTRVTAAEGSITALEGTGDGAALTEDSGVWDAESQKIENIANGVSGQDAIPFAQQQLLGVSRGSAIADHTAHSKKITKVAEPVDVDDACTKQYADNIAVGNIPDDSITNIKMADDSIGADELIDGSVGLVAFDTDVSDMMNFADGATLDKAAITVTSNGTVITLSMEQEGGGDVRLIFSTGIYTFDCTPIATLTLTAGTDASPTEHWIYIPESTKVLTSNTSGFPDTEITPIARVICQSAASLQTDGAMKVHAYTDHMSNGNGHLYHINSWIRNKPANYLNGVAQTMTISGTPSNVILTTTAGEGEQLHDHTFPAFTGTPDVYVVNDQTTAYTKITDFNAITTDTTGATLTNRRFSIIVGGVINEVSGDCKLFANKPSGSYNSDAEVIADASNFANFAFPLSYQGTLILISRYDFYRNNSDIYTIVQHVDLRGQYANTAAGGGGGTGGGSVDVVSNVAQDVILGRVTAGSGDSEELSATQVRTLINVEDGSTADQTAGEIEAIVSHDNLLDYVGNKHVKNDAGTGAARPTAAAYGIGLYFATDTLVWSFSNATVWFDVETNTNVTHTGDVTDTAGSLALNAGVVDTTELAASAVEEAKIATGAVTVNKIGTASVSNAKLNLMAAETIKGNDTGAGAAPQDLSIAEVQALIGFDPFLQPKLFGVLQTNGTGSPILEANSYNLASVSRTSMGLYTFTFSGGIGLTANQYTAVLSEGVSTSAQFFVAEILTKTATVVTIEIRNASTLALADGGDWSLTIHANHA